jgi:hypothetical protein
MTITYAVGQRLTAALLQQIADYTVNRPSLTLTQQSAQSISNNTTTALTFGAGSEAGVGTYAGWHSTSVNTSRISPTTAGYYDVVFGLSMAAPSVSFSQLLAAVGVTGTRIPPQRTSRPSTTTAAAMTLIVVARDVYMDGTSSMYIEGYVNQQQSSGTAAQNTSVASGFASILQVIWARPF